MKREEFSCKLHDEMAFVRVDGQLRQRTLARLNGKEQKPVMKKKISAALVFALLLIAMCAAALAVVGRWGVLDFVGRYAVIPDDAMRYMESDVAAFENDAVCANVRELYYDGRTLRFVADVTPKDEKTLLIGTDLMLDDNYQNLFRPRVEDWDEEDRRTIRDVYAEMGYEVALSVNVSVAEEETDRFVGGSMDYTLADGVLSVYRQIEFADDLDKRGIVISVSAALYADPMSSEQRDYDRYSDAKKTLHLTAAKLESVKPAEAGVIPDAYVSMEPVIYESVGVRVDRLLIEVKPQEIYATIDYTVIDEKKYDATDGGLWFEFIDPKSTEAVHHRQRLAGGLTGGGGTEWLNEEHTRFRQKETLARSELHDIYTVRAYDAWKKGRYDTHTLSMRPAMEADFK